MLKWMPKGVPAVLLSLLVCPGLGQLYNKQWLKAALLGGGFIVSALLCLGSVMSVYGVMMDGLMTQPDPQVLSDQIMHSMGKSVPAMCFSVVFYVWAAIDAYRDSRRLSQEPT